VIEELISLKSLRGITSEEDLLLGVCETMEKLERPRAKLKGMTVERGPSMLGEVTGLMDTMRREIYKK
jgi:hypothetical protein